MMGFEDFTWDQRTEGCLVEIEDESDEPEEQEQEPEDMDVEVKEVDLPAFPEPDTSCIVYSPDRSTFRVAKDAIPPESVQPIAHAFLGLAKHDELSKKNKLFIYNNAIMPILVHGSPCISFVQGGHADRPTVMPLLYSLASLQQFKAAIATGLVSFNADFITPKVYVAAKDEFEGQVKKLGNMADQRLEDMYANNPTYPAFMEICIDVSFAYLHLLETFIWNLLLRPFSVAWERVLTPRVTFKWSDCSPDLRILWRDQSLTMQELYLVTAVEFFKYIGQEKTGSDIIKHDMFIQYHKEGESWNGQLPRPIVEQYYEFMKDA